MITQLNRVISGVAGLVAFAATGSVTTAQMGQDIRPMVYYTGFESPAYLAGPLVGQDGWAVSSLIATKSSAVVQSKVFASGSQAVCMTAVPSYPSPTAPRIDTEWTRAINYQTTIEKPILDVEWDMYLTASKDPSTAWEFKLYGAKDKVLCTMSVRSSTSDTVYYWVGGPQPISTDTRIERNAWNHFRMRLDYVAGTIDFYLNDAYLNPLGDRPIATDLRTEGWVGGVGILVSGPANDAAYFDNVWVRAQAVDCRANCDGSTVRPLLNANDFLCFIKAYEAALELSPKQQFNSYANFDRSVDMPVLNVNDFTAFLSAYAAGCP